MRTINYTVYNFNELSDEAKKVAIDAMRESVSNTLYDFDCEDYRATLEAFEEITKCRAENWEVGWGRAYYRTNTDRMDCMGEYRYYNAMDAEEIKGKHLLRYLNNYILPKIEKPKMYFGKSHKKRASRIQSYGLNDYGLTGIWSDVSIIKTIADYIKNFANEQCTTLHDLMERCLDSFFGEWAKAYDNYYDSDKAISEHIEINEFEFNEDGTPFKYAL